MNNPNHHGSPPGPGHPQAMAPYPGQQQHPPQYYGHGGYPQAYPPQAHGYAPPQAPVNIVLQNTMSQGHPHAGGLVRVANRQKGIAVILALFLGGLGIHRFYLGQTGMGVVYLLFCWTFIPAFIALIEALVLLVMSSHEFDMKYNAALM